MSNVAIQALQNLLEEVQGNINDADSSIARWRTDIANKKRSLKGLYAKGDKLVKAIDKLRKTR